MPRGVSRYDEAALQRRLWTPAVLRPDAWFDASDLSTITATTNGITQWSDKSGNGRHKTDAGYGCRADLTVDPDSGNTVASFVDQVRSNSTRIDDYRGDILEMSADLSIRTAYLRLRRKSNPLLAGSNFIFTSRSSFHWHGPGASSTSTAIADGNASPNWTNGSNFRNGQAITVTAQGAGPIGQWSIYSFLCAGVVLVQGIGNDRNLYHGSVGDYAEIILYATAHSTRERQLHEGYLAWKSNSAPDLPASHPFANRPPLLGD